MSPKSGRQRTIDALTARYRELHPAVALDPEAYLISGRFMDNVLPGVRQQDFEADLRQGDGRELDHNFLAVYSSSALCVNVFARFKSCPHFLTLAGGTGIPAFTFEGKCPVGLTGRSDRHPPNLDLLAIGRSGINAIESKCTEYLSPKKAKFSPAYERDIKDARRDGPWFRAMRKCKESSHTRRYLDVAQLIKHAFGIANIDRLEGTSTRAAKLVYLYWEPINATEIDECRAHCTEIGEFSKWVAGGYPSFLAMTYGQLWNQWDKLEQPHWLRAHVSNLRKRYEVSI